MRISNYAEVRDALYHRESFVHGSCHAERREGFTGTKYPTRYACEYPTRYDVYSYGTRILSADDGHVVYFDNRQYSQTTSRLQNMIRDTFDDLDDARKLQLYS